MKNNRDSRSNFNHTSPFHTAIPVNYHKTTRLSWYDFSIKQYAILATEQQNWWMEKKEQVDV